MTVVTRLLLQEQNGYHCGTVTITDSKHISFDFGLLTNPYISQAGSDFLTLLKKVLADVECNAEPKLWKNEIVVENATALVIAVLKGTVTDTCYEALFPGFLFVGTEDLSS